VKRGFLKSAEGARKFELEEVKEPNLYREIFPYTEVCKTLFDYNIEIPSPPEEIFITDTTFRDGQQSRAPYTIRQILDLYDMLHRLGGATGVIRQCEFFLYSDKDKEVVRMCQERGYRYPEITGWIRANEKDFEIVKEMNLEETGILTSVSDYHIFLKLKKDRKKAMRDYLRIVEKALEEGIRPRCHFEDFTRADTYGFCVPFAQALMRLSEESGIPVKIRLADTMGFGVPYPGAALPRSVPKLIRAMVHDAGVPSAQLEWHGHNDFYKAVINSATAWLYGCGAVNGSLLGIGERTGNTPIEAMIIEYISLTGRVEGIDTQVITEIRNYFEREIREAIPKNQPFVGSEFNVTRAGIHADGIFKNEEIYNIFDTAKILNRPLGVMINDKSGIAGIVQWINSYLILPEGRKVDKRHPGAAKIYKWVMAQYEKGRVTDISNEEMARLAKKYLPEYFVSDFDQIKRRAHDMAAHLIQEVAELSEIQSMDPEKIEPILTWFVEDHPFIQFAYVVNKEGIKITKNITQIVDRAKYGKVGLHEVYLDREWFIEPMKNGRIHVTGLYTSAITGALCLTVSAPICCDADGEIVGIIGCDIRFEELVKTEEIE